MSSQEEYIRALLDIDGREQCEGEEVGEEECDAMKDQDEDQGPESRKRKRMGGRAGGSADGGDKKNARGKNRPPFVKCLTTMKNFTITELETDLSGDYEELYESGWTPLCRVVEDDLQICTNNLPFGVRLHRRAGEHR